ncbi:MAG: hypothetical protein K9M03_02085 [Kiritimatiellales bacterium]|nr:hypothetical protein [Kiritimatiellales bacterium]
MRLEFLRSKIFWIAFIIAGLLFGFFFTWQLGLWREFIPTPPRPQPEQEEYIFTSIIIFLFALNMGLFYWRKRFGTCPTGTRRAGTLAGIVTATTLICPACILIPISLFGIGFSLAAISPYLPLLRLIAIILLGTSTMMLWPRKV